MRMVAIIQARMGATRLPGKVLMPLGDSCLLDYVVSRCRAVGLSEVVVATTMLERDDCIAKWCREQGVEVFRGEEEDVLSRFLGAAAKYEADYVLRVTGDNAFFDFQTAADMAAEVEKEANADLYAFDKGCPIGAAVELVSFEALKRMNVFADEPKHREHVTLYAYEYPERFNIRYMDLSDILRQPQLRITMDTEADYALLRSIAAAYPGHKAVPTEEVVKFLLRHPEIVSLNEDIRQKPIM